MDKLKEIEQAYLDAFKGKKEFELGVLRMIKASLQNKKIELQKDLSEDDVVSILKTETKKRKDSVKLYKEGGRDDLAKVEEREVEYLSQFLPTQMDEEKIREIVQNVLADLSDDQKTNFGQVMGLVMKVVQGQADGSLVNQIVKEELSK